jgi:hypothetical protein
MQERKDRLVMRAGKDHLAPLVPKVSPVRKVNAESRGDLATQVRLARRELREIPAHLAYQDRRVRRGPRAAKACEVRKEPPEYQDHPVSRVPPESRVHRA